MSTEASQRFYVILEEMEFYVRDGMPRTWFRFSPGDPGVPGWRRWEVDVDSAQHHGWVVTGSFFLGGSSGDLQPHPFALGPMWSPPYKCRAEFIVGDDVSVFGLIEHCDVATEWFLWGGLALDRDRPWNWALYSNDVVYTRSSATSALAAAFAAESEVLRIGARPFQRTALTCEALPS